MLDDQTALDPQWIILRRPLVAHGTPETRIDIACLHPARGIALLDVAPNATPHAADDLHALLMMARLLKSYPGPLPIVQAQVAPTDLGNLSTILSSAFANDASRPPVNAGWIPLALRILDGERVVAVIPPRPAPSRRLPWAAALTIVAATTAYMALRTVDVPAAVHAAAQHLRGPTATPNGAPVPSLSALEVVALLNLGNDRLQRGDLDGARHLFRLAADAGSGLAASMMAQTYDSETAEASEWTERASGLNGGGVVVGVRR